MREERAVLVHEPDPAAVRRHAREIAAVEEDAARVRPLQAGDDPQERALAAAARPEHGDELAVRHLEVDPVERGLAVERDRHVLDPEHQSPPPRRRARARRRARRRR